MLTATTGNQPSQYIQAVTPLTWADAFGNRSLKAKWA